ncbi:MAG TPA: TonB-dependent receptor [Caulobacteraceae bacterium]
MSDSLCLRSYLRSSLVMGASIVALGAIAAPAFAADPPAAAAAAEPAPPAAAEPGAAPDAGGAGGNDVIVTAEHRQTRLQKVPVAVSVFTGASRDRVGINSVQDVTNFAPGFVYSPTTTHAYLRGVGRQSIELTDDSRVATYEDGFYVVSPYQLDKSSLFLNQEQIERGPQNVSGRNAAAGSIDMISVRPTDAPYAEIRATAGNFGHYEVEGAASGQVLPGLDLRLSGYDNQETQGYYKNLAGGPSEGGVINEWYIEAQADLKLGDNADLWTRGFLSNWHNRGDAGSRDGGGSEYGNGSWDETNFADSNTYPGAGLFLNPNIGYAGFAGAARTAALGANPAALVPVLGSTTLKAPGIFNNPGITNINNFAAIEDRTVNLNDYDNLNTIFTYHFPTFDFKYIGGYQQYNYSLNYSEPDSDVTGFNLPGSTVTPAGVLSALGLPGQSQLHINPLVNLNYQQDDQWWSHEVALQSTSDNAFQWTAGLYYYQEHYTNPIEISAPDQPNLAHPLASLPHAFGGPVGGGGLAAANPQNTIDFLNYNLTVQSEAAYGQVSYKFNDQFKVVGDLRFTNDHKFGTEFNREVTFGSAIIAGLSPFFGAATPSLDFTIPGTCPTGNVKSCATGPLAKGVTSIGVVNPHTGIESRGLGDSSSAVTGGAGLEWTPTNDIFVYARYNRGYEDLTFNAGFVAAAPEVAPETINSYEVGYKQNFGHTLSVDVAGFYYDYENLQLPTAVLNQASGLVQTQFINVPKSQSTGIEFEGTWNPVHDLVITASYSFDYTAILTGCSGTVTGGVLTTAQGALCDGDTNDPAAVARGAKPFPGQTLAAAGVIQQSIKGSPLPEAPRNKIAFSVAYTWHFDPGALTLAGSYSWRDVQDGTVFNRAYDNAPSWDDVDLRLLWKGNHDRYEVIGFVKNLLNSNQFEAADGGAGLLGNSTSATTATAGLNEENVFTLAPPRTYGVEVRYKFF